MAKKNTKNTLKSFEDYDNEIKKLALQKSILLDEHLLSKDVDKIIKASSYLKTIDKNDNKTGNLKAFFFSPDNEFSNGLGFKTTIKSLTFDMLRKMGKTPFVNSVVSTRIEQIKRFLKFTTDLQKEGWTIKRKVSPFEEEEYKITDKDKRVIERVAKFLEDGGENNKWDLNDDFEDFIVKFVRDSLELDGASYEIERNRGGKVVSFMATDASMIRFLETIDPVKREEFNFEEVNGYLPIYCQVYNDKILRNPKTQEEIVYYPWELCYGIRNRYTNIRNNGYGVSELEILIEIVTWLLWGTQYNGNIFKNGGMPKGFFTLPETGGDIDQNALNEFRSYWRDTMTGVQAAGKIPFFNQPVKWESMQANNRDMEYARWVELLTVVLCSVYHIDPSELGFRLEFQKETFGQQGQKERLQHSKDKGLKPLLAFLQKQINKYLVSELEQGYQFYWTGIDIEDETQLLDNDIKKLGGGLISLEDAFLKYNERPLNKEKDTILNQVYQGIRQQAMYGGQETNQAVDKMNGEQSENPFSQDSGNPIEKSVQDYINKAFGSNLNK